MSPRASFRRAVLCLGAFAGVASGAPLAAQLVPIGAEQLVNVTAAGPQVAPAIAGEPGGPYLAVWQSTGQDGSGAGIYARLFDASGAAASGELRVAQTTANDQVTPAVAWSPAGTFLVAWASNGQDGSGFGIYARRLQAANGQFVGDEFQVHTTTAGSQVAPKVVAQGNGFVVVWSGVGASGDTNDIYGRGFAATGAGAGATTAEVRLNAQVTGNQVQPALAAAGGGLVVAWASDGADGSGFGVVARRFDSSLVALSAEIPVPEHTVFDQSAPTVAGFASGAFAVAWQRALQPLGSTIGPQPVIALRRFSGNTASGPELQVQADVSRRHESPSLTADSEGALTVAWQEHDLATGDKQVVASRFDAANAPLVVDYPLSSTPTGDQISPALTGAARLLASWASFGQDGSSFGVFARRFGVPLPPCVPDTTTLCLEDDRFRVRASYLTAAGASGNGKAIALTTESGYFWFFDDANVEIVAKIVDACGLAGFDNYWLFATGLTNVEVTLDVVDTWTGDQRTYRNPLNQSFLPILDSGHFRVCGTPAPSATGNTLAAAAPAPAAPTVAAGSCTPDATTLCLNQGRFEVKIDYRTAAGATGAGKAHGLTADSGYFWFFNEANVELVIKVIDACSYNDRYWVFAGGLTNVETHLTVRDTLHPTAVFQRTNPLNQDFAPILSADAFDTCP